MSNAPKSSMEIERKYDVGANTSLPDWASVPGLEVSEPEVRELDAHYFDTAEVTLARHGIAVRHRSGGPDAGWHIKGPRTPQGRLELQWPDTPNPPVELGQTISRILTAMQSDAPPHLDLVVIARVQNRRIAYQLTLPGGASAEFVDDNVTGTDGRTGIVRQWREWELELYADVSVVDGEQLFNELDGVITATGARLSEGSKLGRTTGAQPLPDF